MTTLMEIIGFANLEDGNGDLKNTKIIVVAEGNSFAEMEMVGLEYINSLTTYPENTYIESIKKVKYAGGVIYNENLMDSGINHGLVEYIPEDKKCNFWLMNVAFVVDVKKGKEKVENEKYLIPALTQLEAVTRLSEEVKDTVMDWKITEGKEMKIYSVLVTEATDINLQDKFEMKAGING